ncbi:MAG: DNA-3-methyladenine glycosylase I [Alcanivoracaceae bacterium]|nr:DNA-3-methyladenine glycosylase I [Alcanivoracaceae bacterium]
MMSQQRCPWCGNDPLYQDYHDNVWGVPVHDDTTLFEFLLLEGAQAGLSWITVLRKRENYRAAFDGFDATKIARYTDKRVEKLLQNPGIIRNRLKVQSAVSNARAFLEVQAQFGSFDRYMWDFVDGRPIINHFESMKDVPASTPIAEALSKDLKKRGFRFVGPTIVYAHMQATGMVNDHLVGCYRHAHCAALS